MMKENNKQNQQQQQVRKNNQTKKCHGNRRLQHIERRYRSKGMNDQAIEMLIKFRQVTTSNLQDHLQDCTSQRRATNDNLIVDLTIQPPGLSTSKVVGEWTSSFIRTRQKTFKQYNMSADHWRQTSQLIPNYKQLSSYRFKHLLMKAISNEQHGPIERLLDNVTVLEFLQRRAELMCTVFQLKIEQDYWNYIGNLNVPVVVWLSNVSKDVTKQNFINWDHTKTKQNIKHRQEIINNKLEQAEINLILHFQQPYPMDWQIQNQNSMNHSLQIIYNALAVVLYNSLYYFHQNFEQKKILLNYDIHDAYLVKSFYDLNPTKEQIAIVQQLWRPIVKSSKKVLRQNKKNKNNEIYCDDRSPLPPPPQQFPSIHSTEIFSAVMRTIIEARQTNINQRTEQLMSFIHTIDDTDFF